MSDPRDEQITCDNCGVPLFVTTTRLVDSSGGVQCRDAHGVAFAYHDHRGIMADQPTMSATYAAAARGEGGNHLVLAKEAQ